MVYWLEMVNKSTHICFRRIQEITITATPAMNPIEADRSVKASVTTVVVYEYTLHACITARQASTQSSVDVEAILTLHTATITGKITAVCGITNIDII